MERKIRARESGSAGGPRYYVYLLFSDSVLNKLKIIEYLKLWLPDFTPAIKICNRVLQSSYLFSIYLLKFG